MTVLLECAGKRLDIRQPQVMGILNLTPDSFADGGYFFSKEAALAHARRMVQEGAAIIDVGGESTRPGAAPVGVQQELDRVLPIIEALLAELPVVVSVDTRKTAVMRAAIAAGVHIVNDVMALREAGALDAVADSGVAVCLMHMGGDDPATMQQAPHYSDVVAEVGAFLAERVQACVRAGIARNRLLVDPGFGFGKTPAHNLRLICELPVLGRLDLPILVGVSRKSTLGVVTGRVVEDRLAASLALAALAVWLGATVVRTHDVRETVDALLMTQALRDAC